MQIHSRKMNVSSDVRFDELAKSCDDFNGAQCKAVCIEAGMLALRRGADSIFLRGFYRGDLKRCKQRKKPACNILRKNHGGVISSGICPKTKILFRRDKYSVCFRL